MWVISVVGAVVFVAAIGFLGLCLTCEAINAWEGFLG